MSKYDEYLQEIGNIEATVFSDAWSKKSIEESLEHEYNLLLVLLCDESDNELYRAYQCGKKIYEICDNDNNANYQLAGYVIFTQLYDESELLRIAIDKCYRGKGFGGRLLETYIKHISKNCEKAFLEVRDSNKIAKSLYEKYGYAKIATRKQYYSNPLEDGIIYEYIPKNAR